MQKKKQTPLVDRIPDPIIARLLREGRLQDLTDLQEETRSRHLTLTFKDGTQESMIFLRDTGLVPDTAKGGSGPCKPA